MNKQSNQMAVRYKSLADGNNAAFKWENSLDKIFSPGCYVVEIEHSNSDVGLPVDCCRDEHYIVGTLLVTDSGTNGHKQNNRVTGQVLIFTLRTSKETKMFTRTHSAGAWEKWRTIAQTGMYDDIANPDELYASVSALVAETKRIEENLHSTIINYNDWKGTDATLTLHSALADETFVRSVTSGTIVTFKSGTTTWQRYQYTAASTALADIKNPLNWKELSGGIHSIEQAADTSKVQVSATDENGNVKEVLNIAAASEELAGVMTANDKQALNKAETISAAIVCLGTFETSALAEAAAVAYASKPAVTFLLYKLQNGNSGVIQQLFSTAGATIQFLYLDSRKYVRTVSWATGAVGQWFDVTGPERIKNLSFNPATCKISFRDTLDNAEWGGATLPLATAEAPGLMSASDKQNLADTIAALATEVTRAQAAEAAATEQARKLALRDLFVAAGALYNDTGADISRTAPWGETVTHKAGHYYLNGLGDITEEQMKNIYNAPHNALYEQAYAEEKTVRTLFFWGCSSSAGLNSRVDALFLNCSNLEVLGNNNGFFYFANSTQAVKNVFRNCKKLRVLAVKSFYASNITFDSSVFLDCQSLEYLKLERLHFPLSMASCLRISKESVVYIIQKAQPQTAITITLHPDAYARLANDAEIVAALEAQPLVSLVSA